MSAKTVTADDAAITVNLGLFDLYTRIETSLEWTRSEKETLRMLATEVKSQSSATLDFALTCKTKYQDHRYQFLQKSKDITNLVQLICKNIKEKCFTAEILILKLGWLYAELYSVEHAIGVNMKDCAQLIKELYKEIERDDLTYQHQTSH
ncbi:hypothetical protein CAEBREN_07696 [Caenorhabditis brenneri]|uniref:Uncharacterized protein n=1 Tax=Caenorhabditis brenneri TaxID=135651 RepID=G0MXB4_CAEBE|nr:hypothetical protein CAEBREN_07696 [Caenorhabditis brenneri]